MKGSSRKSMWEKIAAIFSRDNIEKESETETLDELRLATAALMVRASAVDGDISAVEMDRLSTLLQSHFDLSSEELADLVHGARDDEHDSVDLYSYTKVITAHLDQTGRIGIIELLWEVCLADGKIDEFEANMVWRVAELIGVSTRDRVLLKKKVMKQLEE